MRIALPHPRDPTVTLGATRPLFGAWHLTVNGQEADEGADGTYAVILPDGSRSLVAIEERRLDPYPIFVVDGERFPIGGPLGASGVIGALIPLLGVVMGPVGILLAVVGALVTLRVARARAAPPLRLVTGIGFLFLIWGVGIALWMTIGPGRTERPTAVTWTPLPAVPGIRPGMAARTVLGKLPELAPVDTLPASNDTIPPFALAEVRQLRTWVLAGRFSEAEEALRRLAQEARGDVRRETRWRVAYRMTFQALPDSFIERLDDWVAVSPNAAEPLAARAWNRYWIGYYWRGEGAMPVGAEARQGFLNAMAQAANDAQAALALDPDQMPAYWVLLNIARTEGDQEAALGLLSQALRRSPTSFESYATAMVAFYPVWGGSLEEMQQLGDAAAAGAGRNPDLERLRLYATWKDADMSVESPRGEGIPEARRVAAAVRDPLFYETLGHALWHSGDPTQGLAYLDTALMLDPTYAQALETRHKVHNALAGNGTGARAQAELRARDADIATQLMLRPLMDP